MKWQVLYTKKTLPKKKNKSSRPSKTHHRFGYNIDSNLKNTHANWYISEKNKKLYICTWFHADRKKCNNSQCRWVQPKKKVGKQLAKIHKNWQTVGKGSQKLANSWQEFTKVGKQLAKVHKSWQTVGKNSRSSVHRCNRSCQQISLSPSIKVKVYPSKIYVLAENLFLQLVYLAADNLQ